MGCIAAFVHLIHYVKCKNSTKLFSHKTKLFNTLAEYFRGLDLRFVSFVLITSETIVQRWFND